MKHEVKFHAPFIATIDDETPMGKLLMEMAEQDFSFFQMNIAGSTLLNDEFDSYMEKMNEGSKFIVVSLDKDAVI